MKTVHLIGGAMGVGKTAVCRALQRRLGNAVFLDGDWCWDASPFLVTEETKAMVQDNICHVLRNFLRCSAYDNVLFCWVMHEQAIIDRIVTGIGAEGCTLRVLSLTCTEAALRERLENDIAAGLRTPDVIGRSLLRREACRALAVEQIDTTDRSIEAVAETILSGCGAARG